MVKNPPANEGDLGVGKIPYRKKGLPTPVFLPGKSHGQRSLASYSPWGCKESEATEHACTLILCLVLPLSICIFNFSMLKEKSYHWRHPCPPASFASGGEELLKSEAFSQDCA